MNIAKNDLKFIAKAVSNNAAVLFLGAGFSVEAKNRFGQPIPLGKGFAEILWGLLGYSKPYDGSDLATVFQAAVKKCRHEELKQLFEDNFSCQDIPSWYRNITGFWWHRIYTTNVDNLIEKIYQSPLNIQRLDVFNGVTSDVNERDQFLEKLQYIKLNGDLVSAPAGVTFSVRQYARRSVEADPWYDQFVRDSSSKVTLFVGTNLDEPPFWKAIEERGKKYADLDNRPRSFLICPDISPAKADVLKELRVLGICGSAKEFFEILSLEQGRQLTRQEVLIRMNPQLEGMFKLMEGRISDSNKRHLEQFYRCFRPISAPEQIPSVRKLFLQGSEPQWPDIYNNLDAPRQVNNEVLDVLEKAHTSHQPSVIAISGSAGSGKSTLLKRVALTLAENGQLVFFTESEELPAVHEFEASLDIFPERPILVFDNVSLALPILPDYLLAAKRAKQKPTFLIAGRTNSLVDRIPLLRDRLPVVELHMPDLSTADIDHIIDLLDKYNLLGELANKARAAQQSVFRNYAHRQILVAMRCATMGRGFDEIIKDEFFETKPVEATVLYLCVCLVSSGQSTISKQQLVSCSEGSPDETLSYINHNLKDLLIPTDSNPDRFSARHRVIADLIVDKIAPRKALKEAYIRVLSALSHDMPFPAPRTSTVFKLYRRLISHKEIYRHFSSAIVEARAIYDALASFFKRDHHFWLQYGSLELEYGELDTAANYLKQASAYAPDNNLVQTTLAYLFYKQSVTASQYEVAKVRRDEAREILLKQAAAQPTNDYPVHIYCTQELAWIERWLTKRDERRSALDVLRQYASQALKSHGLSKDIKEAAKKIEDAYWDLATDK